MVFSQRGSTTAGSDGLWEVAAQSMGVPELQRGIGTEQSSPSGPLPVTTERFSSRLMAHCHLQRQLPDTERSLVIVMGETNPAAVESQRLKSETRNIQIRNELQT